MVDVKTESSAALEAMFGKPGDGVFSGTVARERSGRDQYWRKPDGWIVVGPEVGTNAPRYQSFVENKRYKILPPEFGQEVRGRGVMTASNPSQIRGKEHMWLTPFIEAGGLTYKIKTGDTFAFSSDEVGNYLFCMEQIVALNLHRLPGVKELRPDLADAIDLECPYGCIEERTRKRRLFSGVNKVAAQASLDQHCTAVHKDAVASRAVGQTIAASMEDLKGQQIDANLIAAITAAVVQALKPAEQQAIAAVALQQNTQDMDSAPVQAVPPPAVKRGPGRPPTRKTSARTTKARAS